MRILFVDDDPDTCEMFGVVFQMEGHLTHIAHNGLEAVKAVQHTAFDGIVMDVEMPLLNGIEATRQVRQLSYGQQVPILVFTGYSGQDYEKKALEAGANKVLYKPIFPFELLKWLSSLIEHRSN